MTQPLLTRVILLLVFVGCAGDGVHRLYGRWPIPSLGGFQAAFYSRLLSLAGALVPSRDAVLMGLGVSSTQELESNQLGLRAFLANAAVWGEGRPSFVWGFPLFVRRVLAWELVRDLGFVGRVRAWVTGFWVDVDVFSVRFGLWAPDLVHPRDFAGPFVRRALFYRSMVAGSVVLAIAIAACRLGIVVFRGVLEFFRSGLGMLWPTTPVLKPLGTAKRSSFELIGITRYHGFLRHREGDYVPITSSLAQGRLRRRARWVRVLESALGGRRGVVATFLRGRWTPDLPSQDRDPIVNYVLGSVQSDVRVLGGGLVTGKVGDETKPVVYLVVDTPEQGPALFVPEMVGRLRQYSLYRQRDQQLLGALRTRAVEWCRDLDLGPVVSDLFVCDSVAWAYAVSTHEDLASHRVLSCQSKLPFHTAPV